MPGSSSTRRRLFSLAGAIVGKGRRSGVIIPELSDVTLYCTRHRFSGKGRTLQDRSLPFPEKPADVDCVIERFIELFGRSPNAEERSALEYIRRSLMDKEAAIKKAAAD